jgi:hypothetical protein
MTQDKPVDLDALWEQLKSKPTEDAPTSSSAPVETTDIVKIKRTYEFAGQVVTYIALVFRILTT